MIERFERSGHTVESFCARREIPPATFRYWRWLLAKESGLTVPRASADVRLIPVEVVDPVTCPAGSTPIVITVSNVDIRVEVGTDPTYVSALIRELRARR